MKPCLLIKVAVAGGLGLALLSWAAACSTRPPANVVIVTLDTTRADRLPAYGYRDVLMPHLDRLAAEGVVFNQATSVSPLTLPAHTSLFTGLLPPAHGVRDNGDEPLAESHATLAEILRSNNFRTAAFVGSVVLDPSRGLAQGFEHYGAVQRDADPAGSRYSRRADAVVNGALEWLDRIGSSRFLLWTHFYDPHRPYDPPEPFRSIPDPYVGELAFADSQIGRLIQALETRGLLDRTLIVVAGDHGESLGEHGERDHGIFVYEGVLRIPLIVRAPNLQPQRIAEVVRLTDIMPTVLDLLGVGGAAATDGVTLVPRMRGSSQVLELEAYAESLYPQRFGWSPIYALRDGRFKYIEAPRPELYDLHGDPFEERNIYSERPNTAMALRQRLWETRGAATAATGNEAAAGSADLHERLAALGYVGSAPHGAAADGENRPDPKDCIGTYNTRLNVRPRTADRDRPVNETCSSIPTGPVMR